MGELEQAIRPITIKGFRSWDTESPECDMDPHNSPDCLNVIVQDGIIYRRPVIHKEVGDAGTALEIIPDGAAYQVDAAMLMAANKYIARVGNTAAGVYSCTSIAGAWSSLGTSVGRINGEFAYYNGGAIFPAGAGLSQKCTGTALTTLGGTPPAGVTVAPDNNMLFLAAGTTGSSLRFSGIGTENTWLDTDALAVGIGDAYYSWALKNMGDWLLATRPTGIWAVRGYGRSSLRVDQLSDGWGSIQTGHIVNGPTGAFLFGTAPHRSAPVVSPVANDAGIFDAILHVSRAGRVEPVSNIIKSSDLFGPAQSAYNELYFGGNPPTLRMHYDPYNEILYVIPYAYANDGTAYGGRRVYVLTNSGWAKWTFSANNPISCINAGRTAGKTLVTGPATATMKYVFRFNDSPATDQGGDYFYSGGDTYQALESYWCTPRMALPTQDRDDTVHFMYLAGSGAVTVYSRVNDATAWTNHETWTLSSHGVRIPLGVRGRAIQFKFLFSTLNDGEIHWYTMGVEPYGASA